MSELLFRCPKCSKSLAVDKSRIGSKLPCSECSAKIKVPKAAIDFKCSECGLFYCSPADLIGGVFSCPECDADITVPAESVDVAPKAEARTVKVAARSSDLGPIISVNDEEAVAGGSHFAIKSDSERTVGKKRVLAKSLMITVLVTLIGFLGWYFLDDMQRGVVLLTDYLDSTPEKPVQNVSPLPKPEPRVAVTNPEVVKKPSVAAPKMPTEIESEDPVELAVNLEDPKEPSEPVEPKEPVEAVVKVSELSSLRGIYDKAMQDVRVAYEREKLSLPANYIKALKLLQGETQASGDLDSWLIVEKEMDRFMVDPRILDRVIVKKYEPVKALQLQYLIAEKGCILVRNEKIGILSKRYIDKLTELKTSLTKKGDINDALRVHAEIQRVQSSPEVMAVEFERAEAKEKEQQATIKKPVAIVKPPRNVVVKRPEVKMPEVKKPIAVPAGNLQPVKPIKKTQIAIAGDPVITRKISEKKPNTEYIGLTIRPSARTPLKDKIKVKAVLGSKPDVSSADNATAKKVFKYKKRTTAHYVLLSMQGTSKRSTFKKPLIVVQYFTEGGTTGEEPVPRQVAVDIIRVPIVDKEWIYVECPTVTTTEAVSTYSSSGYRRIAEGGSDLLGVMISLFSSDGTLVYQGSSTAILKEQGIKKLPKEFTSSKGQK